MEVLERQVIQQLSQDSLECLGCGTGVIGLSFWLDGLAKELVCASDFRMPSEHGVQENFKRHGERLILPLALYLNRGLMKILV